MAPIFFVYMLRNYVHPYCLFALFGGGDKLSSEWLRGNNMI